MKTLFTFGLILLSATVAVSPYSFSHAADSRSAIQRLNLQRASTQQSQVYVPRGFQRDKENSITVRGTGQSENIAILYRYLPLKAGADETPQQLMVELNTDARVKQVVIPLPSTEQVSLDTKKPSRFKKDATKKETATKPSTDETVEELNPNGYQYNSIQLQAVVVDAEGNIVRKLPMIGAGGQPAQHDVLPLLEPHDGNNAVVLPAIPGVDPSALRGIQTMAELAGDEEKRARLQYDGTINRGRSLDKNSLMNGSGGGGSPSGAGQ